MTKSFLRFFDAVYGLNGITIKVNDVTLKKPISFGGATEYFDAYEGEYDVIIYRNNMVIMEQTITLVRDEIATFCIVTEKSDITLFKVTDTQESHNKKKRSEMRFANLVPNSGAYNITMNGMLIATEVEYLEVTPFEDYMPSTYALKVFNSVTNKQLLSAPKTVMKPNYIYTTYIIGQTGGKLYAVNTLEGSTYIVM